MWGVYGVVVVYGGMYVYTLVVTNVEDEEDEEEGVSWSPEDDDDDDDCVYEEYDEEVGYSIASVCARASARLMCASSSTKWDTRRFMGLRRWRKREKK